jgi:hypothetical protein
MTIDRLRLTGTVILIAALIMGCSGTYGKISKQSGTEKKVTLADLINHRDNYDIYYGRRSNTYADAIMFDPKNNSTKLTGKSWIKIEDQETLNKRIEDMLGIYNYAKIHIIVGADNQFFGYMYYPGHFHVTLKIIDEKTLYVGSLPKYKSAP